MNTNEEALTIARNNISIEYFPNIMENIGNKIFNNLHCLTDEDVKTIVRKYKSDDNDVVINNYIFHKASSKMLGFLADYWKLKVTVSLESGRQEVLDFFIKVVSKSSPAKANMVREMKLFQKETFFYHVLKERLEVSGLKRWSARFVTTLDEAMVFEDLNALQYEVRDKFLRFDIPHTFRVLETLARFHASSIILEETKGKVLGRPYVLHEEYKQFLDKGGFRNDDPWFQLCIEGALEAIKAFSKYGSNEELIEDIEARWRDVWCSALDLSDFSKSYRNVICHRDLWNNNILFHYKEAEDVMTPDDCVLVDFAAVRCQPPAGDVMLTLYCNLDPKFREENIDLFLNYYYDELKLILDNSNIDIENIETRSKFFECAEEQRQWALIVCACLMPQFWINDDLMTEIFTDSEQFTEILCNDKGAFINKMMQDNQDYKDKIIEIFDEIVERYCLHASQ